MKLTSNAAIMDLEDYVASFGFRLSKAAKNIFEFVERHAESINTEPIMLNFFLYSILENVPQFRIVIENLGGDPNKAISALIDNLKDDFVPYDEDITPYSNKEKREVATRTMIIDLSIAIGRRNLRREIFDVDVVEAPFEVHEEQFPASTNEEWTDEQLHTNYNTLAHLLGHYEKSLDIPITKISKLLGIGEGQKSPVEAAPASVRASVLRLFQDYPDYNNNCFLIMSFSPTKFHSKIHQVLKNTFEKFQINLLRADERSYSDDLLGNIETYLHGCSFAVAVFERLESEVYNPNVSFEVGYLYALKKPICLLKERTMLRLHSDLMGKLYVEFDIQDIEGTLPSRLENWLRDMKKI
jgi:hypothetical protein